MDDCHGPEKRDLRAAGSKAQKADWGIWIGDSKFRRFGARIKDL
jgi:hypothetical protein